MTSSLHLAHNSILYRLHHISVSRFPHKAFNPNNLNQQSTMSTAIIPGPASDGPTPLGRYRLLSPLASIRVSPLALGGMSIGDKWGNSTKEASFKVMDAYYEAGGNFIDTSNA